jgi:HD-GYP domain-containing protein (c-di-GMP phosphodiesterase class II)
VNAYHERLAATAEGRFFGIAAHMDRMSRFAEAIGRRLGFDAERAQALRGAARLHDLGKLAIPDGILLKPGRLSPAERLIVEQHPRLGYEMLRDSGCELLDVAASIALFHHERWDGAGYPSGARSEEIPVEARIASVADVFDSLTRERPYRRALTLVQALKFVKAGRGTHFDPDVVDAFFAAEREIQKARKESRRRDVSRPAQGSSASGARARSPRGS